MSESHPNNSHPEEELKQNISREQVIQAFSELSGDGQKDPADLDLDNPEVKEANELFYEWFEQQTAQLPDGDLEGYLHFEARTTTLFVEAGFHDPDYLDEVANDWLIQTLERAEEAGLTSLVKEIEAKITGINTMVSRKGEQDLGEITAPLREILTKLESVLSEDNIEFLKDHIAEGMDFEGALILAYGALEEEGLDPDEILKDLGILE